MPCRHCHRRCRASRGAAPLLLLWMMAPRQHCLSAVTANEGTNRRAQVPSPVQLLTQEQEVLTDGAKEPSFAPPPPPSLPTPLVCAAICPLRASERRPTMPRHHRLRRRRATVQENGQLCRGTVVHAAAAAIAHTLPGLRPLRGRPPVVREVRSRPSQDLPACPS